MRESEICDNLIEHATNLNFRVFGEYEGWDIVLSRGDVTIGIQAKLQINLHLIAQAVILNNVDFKVIYYKDDIRSKDTAKDYKVICKNLGLIRISLEDNIPYFVDIGQTNSVFYSSTYYYNRMAMFLRYRHYPKKKIIIPEFDYENPSGVNAPRTVTQYNISLVKLDIFADKQGGWLTTQQFKQFGFSRIPKYYFHYNFLDKKWYKDPNHNASLDYPHITKGLLGHV